MRRTRNVSLITLIILNWYYITLCHAQIDPEPEVTCAPCTCEEQTMICTLTRYLPPPQANVTDVQITESSLIAQDVLVNLTNITVKSLTLKHAVLGEEAMLGIFLSDLESLVIDHAYISYDTAVALGESLHYSSLQRLTIISPLYPTGDRFLDWECQMKPTFYYFLLSDAALTIQQFQTFVDMSKDAYSSCGLRVLNLSHNDLSAWPNSSLDGFPMLEELYLDHNRVAEIAEFSFASESLQKLQFSNNGYDFYHSPGGIFSHSPQLRELDISGNNLVRLKLESLSTLFSTNLTRLEKLNMKNSGVLHLPKGIFDNLPKLKTLDLAENEIVQWSADVFSGLPNLQTLNISSNAINVVMETSLPVAAVSMDLSSNPFSCTCDLLWFRRAIPGIQHKLLRFPEGYVCSSPPSHAGKLVTTMAVDTGACENMTDSSYTVTMATAIATSMILFVIIVTLVYFFRKPILRKIRTSRGVMPYYRMHPSETG